jgi:hypothetical protein
MQTPSGHNQILAAFLDGLESQIVSKLDDFLIQTEKEMHVAASAVEIRPTLISFIEGAKKYTFGAHLAGGILEKCKRLHNPFQCGELLSALYPFIDIAFS